ncbi:ABC transporter ATP-binding protein [Pseudodesulfovibrio sp. zrk46]|uniref:ABC transporter ATP-binding protein n=1 Tax=Pseudodesulfovibrio sp. zrk46 TaxID=2725288 RepID=UPI001FFCEB8B|nr:ABC transporter ATP-binding protein [Pseudodesulfovibrio sp. zrk46]
MTTENNTGMGPDDILSIQNLSLSFPTFDKHTQVLHDISFSVKRGENLAIVGESGSGKTVTMRRVIQLLKLARTDSGKILLRGKSGKVQDITNFTNADARSIRGSDMSMIFQEPMTSLNPLFTIGNQLAEAVLQHNDMSKQGAWRRAIDLLELVRIPDAEKRANEYPHQMSGGMRQRVMTAMALACNPQLLIADEPTTALDVTIQAQILALIRQLQEEIGMAVVFITHDMGVVAEFADRAIVMYKGEVVEENDVKTIFKNPQHPYTKALLSSVPKLGSMTGTQFPSTLPILDMEAELKGDQERPVSQIIDTPNYDGDPILEVNGLTTRFVVKKNFFGKPTHRVHAVEDVAFKLYPGETLGIVGESGCGKSTTGYSILKLEESTGSIKFQGEEISQYGDKQMQKLRENIQLIFQDPFASLNPRRTIGTSIAEPMIIHDLYKGQAIEDRVHYLLERVGIPKAHASRYPHEFSGGQRQRIAIARALSTNPKVVIADEAVSALDVSVQATVLNLMMELQKELGLAYMFISHDMAVVERVSHRVAVMFLGQIVEMGTRQDIFENPQHAYTKRLLAAVPVADPERRTDFTMLKGEIPSPIRCVDDLPPKLSYREINPGHVVAEGECGAIIQP